MNYRQIAASLSDDPLFIRLLEARANREFATGSPFAWVASEPNAHALISECMAHWIVKLRTEYHVYRQQHAQDFELETAHQ